MLECCKESKYIKRFIHISTDEVYGETAYGDNTHEESILLPTNPYAATKAGAEHLVRSYHKSFKLPVILTRSNNVYGPHQYPEKVIPKFICLLENDRPCSIHGKGDSMRSFIYIDDVIKAYDIVLHYGKEGDVYNICSENEYSIKELAEMIIKNFYPDKDINKYIEYVEDRAFNDLRYHIDGNKMKDLGFTEETPFLEGLEKTINWYRNTNLKEIWPLYELSLDPHPVISQNINVTMDI